MTDTPIDALENTSPEEQAQLKELITDLVSVTHGFLNNSSLPVKKCIAVVLTATIEHMTTVISALVAEHSRPADYVDRINQILQPLQTHILHKISHMETGSCPKCQAH